MEVQEPDNTLLQMNTDVWIHDLGRNTQIRLTFGPEVDHSPIWTPDGRRVVMVSGSNLVSKSADGTGQAEPVSRGLNAPVPYAWSRDGRTLVLDEGAPPDIRLLSLDGDRKSQPLIETQFTNSRPAMSPDGMWIAYQSNESGRPQIYVQPFPEVNRGRWQVSTDRGDSPIWSPDGHELFYRGRGGNTLMVVPVDTGQAFNPGTPDVLFQSAYLGSAGGTPGTTRRAYDVAPDGQRFLMLRQGESSGQAFTGIVVVQSWFEELKRLAPTN
jgi:serine/threonine-protein kinase